MKRKLSMVFISLLVFLISMTSVVFAWPQDLEGRPSEYRPGYSRGFFIWRDNSGFNLRTSSDGVRRVFSGVIRTDGDIVEVRPLRTEGGDRLRVDRARDMIRFRFVTSTDADGVDFRVRGGSMVQFDLHIDGAPARTRAIHLGPYNRRPNDNNFRIYR